jgi:hypothetical protein
LHIAIGRHDDDQQAPLRQAQELDVAKHRRAPGAITTPTNCDRLDSRCAALEMTFCGWSAARRGRRPYWRLAHGQHGVDEQPVATRRGDAPGRGVRADDQAHFFQVGHHVADGRRRQLQPEARDKRARAHRLSVGDVALDQRFHQQLGTIIEHDFILVM